MRSLDGGVVDFVVTSRVDRVPKNQPPQNRGRILTLTRKYFGGALCDRIQHTITTKNFENCGQMSLPRK